MKNPDEKVALQAVEFWSTVAEEEIELKMEEAEVRVFSISLSRALILLVGHRVRRSARAREQKVCDDSAQRHCASSPATADPTGGRCRRRRMEYFNGGWDLPRVAGSSG